MKRRTAVHRRALWVLPFFFGPLLAGQILSDREGQAQPLFARHSRRRATDRPAGSVFRTGASIVLVPVTVRDGRDRPITDLRPDRFRLYEDSVQQKITYFSTEDTPVSVGLVVDVSGSMKGKLDQVRRAVLEFLGNADSGDEFFMVSVSTRPKLVCDVTTSAADVQSRLVFLEASGSTALLDGIHLALKNLRKARHPRKALLILSDGGDNHSRYRTGDIKRTLLEVGTQVYVVETRPTLRPRNPSLGEIEGSRFLDSLTSVTGGRHVQVDTPNELANATASIAKELHDQYLLGYVPVSLRADGKYRRLKVQLTSDRLHRLYVSSRQGFYEPVN